MSLWKIAQNVAKSLFLIKIIDKFYREEKVAKEYVHYLDGTALCKQSPNGRNSPNLVTLLMSSNQEFNL
jgi:hypothetical protein